MPVAGGGRNTAPQRAFSRKTAICARVTLLRGAVAAARAAARDAVVEEVLDEGIERLFVRDVGEAPADVERRRAVKPL